MDGEPVTGDPSTNTLADKSYTEIFIDVFPEYLAMGMSYEQFWHGPAWLAASYRKAHEARHKEEEFGRWRQGMYFYDALVKVAPVMRAFTKRHVEPGKYPEEPWPISPQEAKERERAKKIAQFKRMLATMNKESEANKKKQAEEEAAKQKEASGDA